MSHNGKEFFVGALIGGVVATGLSLFLAPKTGKELREDINDMYCKVSDGTKDLKDQITHAIEDLGLIEKKVEHNGSLSLLLGAGLGVLMGATTLYCLHSTKTGGNLKKEIVNKTHKFIEGVNDTVGETSSEVKEIIEKIADTLTPSAKKRDEILQKINDFAEIGAIGMRLWNQMKRR